MLIQSDIDSGLEIPGSKKSDITPNAQLTKRIKEDPTRFDDVE